MRDLLNTYIRTLTEREDRPQTSQDLGTFVTWLLERHGYRVVMKAVRYDDDEVRKSAGDLQSGVDIRALRVENGERVLYRFVLKTGNITLTGLSGARGTMQTDLWAAAQLDEATDANHTFGERTWDRVVVVAVHNGDVPGTDLQGQIESLRKNLLERTGIDRLEWWDAASLLKLALDASQQEGSLSDAADTQLFPPAVRPFVRLALDSLRLSAPGHDFDPGHIDRLLNELLPRVEPGHSLSDRVEVKSAAALRRHATSRFAELGLFVHLFLSESRRATHGNALPTLDAIERILCRAMAVLPGLPEDKQTRATLQSVVDQIIALYIKAAKLLAECLNPLLGRSGGLAFGFESERLDYPIRVLRFSGYLATAGLAALDTPDGQSRARPLAETLERMWASNPGGALMPVTDDQIVEIGLVWELWQRLGMKEALGVYSVRMIERLIQRQRHSLPMPLIRHRTRIPMDRDDLETLVDAHLRPDNLSPDLQRVSTILTLAGFFVSALGLVDRLESNDARPFEIISQVWQPPNDAGRLWYDQELVRVGTTRTYGGIGEGFVESLRAFCQPIAPSVAEEFGTPVIDRMAWKVFRTPAPMVVFLQRS